MLRLALLLLTACVINVPGLTPPPPQVATTGGTEQCRGIMETCDNTCQTPDCLSACTARGTPEAQRMHSALIGCGQRNFCVNEDCMRANCTPEIDACMADVAAAPPSSTDPQPPTTGPGY